MHPKTNHPWRRLDKGMALRKEISKNRADEFLERQAVSHRHLAKTGRVNYCDTEISKKYFPKE